MSCSKSYLLSNELNSERTLPVGGPGLEAFLNGLNLLRDCRQQPLFQTIELVKTTPSSDLAQPYKDSAHGLKVESLVAVEDEDETAELVAQSFHGLGFTRTCRTKR